MHRGYEAQVETALDLVGKAYEAAAEPVLWPVFLETFAGATDNEGTLIWLQSAADGSARMREPEMAFVANVRHPPEYMQSYAEYYSRINVLLSGIDAIAEGSLMCSSAMLSDAELHRTEYYNDWLKPQGIGYCLGGPVLRRGNDVAMFSTSRLLERGPFPREDLQLTALLIPHLRRACLLHQRLARLRADRSGALAALELLPQAVWLLDAQGCLLLANQAGRELDRQHDGLWLGPDGRPRATNITERQALERCISGAIAAGRGRGLEAHSGVAIHRPADGSTLYAVAYPLAAEALLQTAAVALFVFDPQRTRVAHGEALRVLYGLTPAESRLSAALAQGATVKEYCEIHGLALSTGRTHLRQALAKTGLHRQSQLVALLAQMPLGRHAYEGQELEAST